MPPPSETFSTPVTELLKIKYPIILAGMNTSAGPRLAAAVSNAGGLGIMGGLSYTPAQLRDQVRQCKALLHDKTAFGVDLLIPQIGGSARKTNKDYTKGELPAMIDIIIEEKARLFVCAVGVPPKWAVDKLHDAGILCMNMIGLPAHVAKACDVGMDIVGPTGYEAGGHVGDVGTMVLIPQVVAACKGRVSAFTKQPVHVVAAGGIYNGQTLAAAFALGASAAWVGTRFLASHESTPVKMLTHKKLIVQAKPRDTVRTLVYSGRPLRVFKTDYVKSWEDSADRRAEIDKLTGSGVIPFLHDNKLAEQNKTTARDIGYEKGFSIAKNHRFLMGQGAAGITSIRPAKEILETLMREALECMKSSHALIKPLPADAKHYDQIPEEPVGYPKDAPKAEYTLAEVAKHATPGKDNWIVVNGMVCDVSTFVHPGGPEPLNMWSGRDASEEFNIMHANEMIFKNSPEIIIGALKGGAKM